MYAEQPKKLMIINILDILQKYTDADHRLSQKEIASLLAQEYGMKADRKAIKRNLMNLLEFGYDIAYSESIRTGKSGEEEIIFTDWYMRHKFEDSELRLLIDSLLFFQQIPFRYRKDLIEKIEGLSNLYFKSKVKHVCAISEHIPANKDLFYTIEVLDAAISKHKQVSFQYGSFGMDQKLHPRKREDGTVKTYCINPYQLAMHGGRYYLICNHDAYEDLSNYRVDRIMNIQLLDTPVKPLPSGNGLDLQRYMAEHIYMFTGESIRVKFRAKKDLMNDIIDFFGMNAIFSETDGDSMLVTVKVNEEDMCKWALQYCDQIEVIAPTHLRERVIAGLKSSLERYMG